MKKIVLDLPDKTVLTDSHKKDLSISSWKAQSEKELEDDLIKILSSQGYEYVRLSEKELEPNLRKQLEKLNAQRIPNFEFTDSEWKRFYRENFEGPDNQGIAKKAEKIHEKGDYAASFTRDDNTTPINIKFLDKKFPQNNYVQVMNQFSHTEGEDRNRYDVTILVNGLPLVHIELKRRGNSLKEAFFQIDKYKRTMPSLFEFIQIFVISNGTYTKYYSNTTKKGLNSNSFLSTSYWSFSKNEPICDLDLFSKTFLEKRVLLEIICKYCVFDSEKNLKILRPYQISAIERIICKINQIINNPDAFKDSPDGQKPGGYIWHTTGSGKTLTSFKAAQLALDIPQINKVLFVVDRKSLDQQTQIEYKKYMGEDAGTLANTNTTKDLEKMMNISEPKIIITTIQKLKRFIDKATPKTKDRLKNERVVMIMDECQRSQTKKIHKAISSIFVNKMIFGFTGTPLLRPKKDSGKKPYDESEQTFGSCIHEYKIIHAIKDENVLKFRISYYESNQELIGTGAHEQKRIEKIAENVLEKFDIWSRKRKFNAIFTTESIASAIRYYETFKSLQATKEEKDRLKIAMIFSSDFDGPEKDGDDETQSILEDSNLSEAINDYNKMFGCNFSIKDRDGYRDDIAKRTKEKQIDILLVVSMFTTGYDAPCINTVLVDKNLETHNLIQVFSRANRVFNKDKPYANIVCFRKIKDKVDEALTLFALEKGDFESLKSTIEVASYEDRLQEYRECEQELLTRFPWDGGALYDKLLTRKDKEDFARVFHKFRVCLNTLVDDDRFAQDRKIDEQSCQNYKSTYMNVLDSLRRENEELPPHERISSEALENYDLELIRCDDVDIDYILNLIEKYRREQTENRKEEIMRHVSSHTSFRKEEPVVKEFFERIDRGDDISYFELKKQKFMQASEGLISRLNLKPSETKKQMEKFWDSRKLDFTGSISRKILPDDFDIKKEYKKISYIWDQFKREVIFLFDLFNMFKDQDDGE